MLVYFIAPVLFVRNFIANFFHQTFSTSFEWRNIDKNLLVLEVNEEKIHAKY